MEVFLMLANFEHLAFDKGLHIYVNKFLNLHKNPHWHFETELIVCTCGKAKVILEGRVYELTPDYCLFCYGESIHSIESDEGTTIYIAQFEKNPDHNSKDYRFKTPYIKDRYHIKDRILKIYDEYQNKGLFYVEMINSITTELMVDVIRNEEMIQKDSEHYFAVVRYKRLLSEIDNHYDTLSFHDAASFMNMSDAYFSRAFKMMSGMTFSQYLNVIRISHAIDLLESDPDISYNELLAETGFNTIRNFNRVFKDITGYSPRQIPSGYVLHVRSLKT